MDFRLVARLGARQVSSLLREAVYLGTDIDVTRPSEIRASVTTRCNYKCLQCASWRLVPPMEMTIDQWKKGGPRRPGAGNLAVAQFESRGSAS
jgi:hypothetical protein